MDNSNYPGGNPLGSTEYVDGENRVMVDLWNSTELDLNQAITQYTLSPNNYQPTVLPTCLFKIYPTDTQYLNTDMLSNDTLTNPGVYHTHYPHWCITNSQWNRDDPFSTDHYPVEHCPIKRLN